MIKSSRRELCYFEPTEAWLASRNPKGKKAILAWYKQEKRALAARLHGPMVRDFTASRVMVDKETKKPIRRSKTPTTYSLELWRLSEKDYAVYSRLLEQDFEKIKAAHNKRVKKEKENGR